MPTLRPYQARAVAAAWDFLEKNPDGNPCIVLPTGAGKSLVIAQLVTDAVSQWGCRVLVCAHVKELLLQLHSALRSLCPSVQVGLYSAGLESRELGACTVAGIQSIWRKADHLFPAGVDVVIVDEAHLLPPDGDGMYRTLIAALRAINPQTKVIGLTATPYRTSTGKIVGRDQILTGICYEAPVRDLVRQDFLSRLKAVASPETIDTSKLHIRGGEFIESEAAELLDTDELVQAACDDIVARTRERKSVLVFACGVAHAKHVTECLAAMGKATRLVTGETNDDDRASAIEAFRTGEIKYLVNVVVLTVGFDAPGIDAVVLLRPTMSPGLYYQMCLDEKTEILSRRGWLKRTEILETDSVAAVDPASGAMSWAVPSAIIDRELAPGEGFVAIKTAAVNMRVTDDHDIVYRPRRAKEWKKATARALLAKKDGFDLMVSATESACGIPISDDDIRFIGWMLTDGNVNKYNNCASISQSSAQPHFDEIEKMLKGCGFKYAKRLITAKTQFNESAPRYTFYVSKGKPRGTDKHLTGWGRLAPYIDKNLSPALDSIDERQFAILLETIHLGDGSKQVNQHWTRRSYHISTGNRTFADNLQSLCVRRGWRCNVASGTNNNGNPIYFIHAKKQRTRMIGGQSAKDRAALAPAPAIAGERVWCVRVPTGAIIVRRDGKAHITGNCGRGLRKAIGKRDCLVIDFAGNVNRHGPIDALNGMPAVEPSKDPGEAPYRSCPACLAAGIPLSAWVCPECGEVLRVAKPVHASRSDMKSPVMSDEAIPQELTVDLVEYRVWSKRGASPDAPKTMRVDYMCGLTQVSEWVCVEHSGFAGDKAAIWWQSRCPDAPELPSTVEESVRLARDGWLIKPDSITVERDGEYDRVTRATLAPRGDAWEPPGARSWDELPDDGIPF